MHAVARLTLHPEIVNIQASWVKMGPEGVTACLDAGVNDLGGTLMNESISRAAGTEHGQEMPPGAYGADHCRRRARTAPAHDAVRRGPRKPQRALICGGGARADCADASNAAGRVSASRRLAVLGGTGAEGSGLALRFAHAGHTVTIGSRNAARGAAAAAELNRMLAHPSISGADNAAAAAAAEIVLLAVPYAAQSRDRACSCRCACGQDPDRRDRAVETAAGRARAVARGWLGGRCAASRAWRVGTRRLGLPERFRASPWRPRAPDRLRRACMRRRRRRAPDQRSTSPRLSACAPGMRDR